MEKTPSYDRSGLVNLMAEIELHLTGSSRSPGLAGVTIDDAATAVVLVLFDGLGVAQLEHRAAGSLRDSLVSSLDAPFPTTTAVSLANVATAQPPSQNGQIAHFTWYPELDLVVNTLKWVTVGGEPVPYDYAALLPRPNLWERLRSAGVEPITVQPGDFQTSPLSRAMYRGARFEGAWTVDEVIDATISLAREPGRFIFTYAPFVDVAGHMFGQGSDEFEEAMRADVAIWDGLLSRLPPGVALIGTADHGLMEVTDEDKVLVRDPQFDDLRFAGDPRGIHLWGDGTLIDELAEDVGGELVDPLPLLGPDPTPKTRSHVGDRLLLAPPGKVILPRGFDKRLRCYHGGLMREEVEIPLLQG